MSQVCRRPMVDTDLKLRNLFSKNRKFGS